MKFILFIIMYINFCVCSSFKCIPREVYSNWTALNCVDDYRWFSLPNNSTLRLSNNSQYFSARQYGKEKQLNLQSGKKTVRITLEKDQIIYSSSRINHKITHIKVSDWQHFYMYINTNVDHHCFLNINGKQIDTVGKSVSIEVQNRTYWKIHLKIKIWYTFELCDESKHVVFEVNIDLCKEYKWYFIPDTYLLTDLPVFNDCFISTGKRQVTIYIYIGIILPLILLIVSVSIIYYLVKRKYVSEFQGKGVNSSDDEGNEDEMIYNDIYGKL